MDHKNYGIKDMREGEKIIAVVRPHWFVFFRTIIGLLLLFFIPFLVMPIVLAYVAQGGGVGIPTGLGFFFASFWSLFLWHLLFARWTDYYYDVWVFTSERIVDIEQKGFFKRNIATLVNYNRIEDARFELNGIFGNFLNFGDVQVQTAGAEREFRMEEFANPQNLVRIIIERVAANEVKRRENHG
jgi:energy-coupling factor transporter transmembrane protein EcfT